MASTAQRYHPPPFPTSSLHLVLLVAVFSLSLMLRLRVSYCRKSVAKRAPVPMNMAMMKHMKGKEMSFRTEMSNGPMMWDPR